MATYVIGDVHGWKRGLDALVERLKLDPKRDRLWMVGDLVNRGPDSLGVLRWARTTGTELGDRFACVLGNHDLHLLAAAEGLREPDPDLKPILDAKDAPELLAWLGARTFLHRQTVDGPGGPRDTVLVHAGLHPRWSLDDAEAAAEKLASKLDGSKRRDLLQGHRALRAGSKKDRRLGEALHALTVLRTCEADGAPCGHKGPPEEAPEGCLPWFAVPDAAWKSSGARVVFGHWAALGLRLRGAGYGHRDAAGSKAPAPEAALPRATAFGLDSGAAWGGPLTALRLDDETVMQASREG